MADWLTLIEMAENPRLLLRLNFLSFLYAINRHSRLMYTPYSHKLSFTM